MLGVLTELVERCGQIRSGRWPIDAIPVPALHRTDDCHRTKGCSRVNDATNKVFGFCPISRIGRAKLLAMNDPPSAGPQRREFKSKIVEHLS